MAISSIAATIGKLAMDACLFMSQNFGFIALPDELTTGSSIMPHKKNPDVFELIRARCNKLQALPNQIALITANLPVGYFRDLQLIKEVFMPAFEEIMDCIDISIFAIENMTVKKDLLKNPMYKYAFSVEEVNRLVLEKVPFRDAYKQVGLAIEKGDYEAADTIEHTHEGSIGNLCTEEIKGKMDYTLKQFNFDKVNQAIQQLVS